MATAAGIITVVMGFTAALLLYEATSQPSRNERRQDGERRSRLRRLGILAAIVAVIAAYVAALT